MKKMYFIINNKTDKRKRGESIDFEPVQGQMYLFSDVSTVDDKKVKVFICKVGDLYLTADPKEYDDIKNNEGGVEIDMFELIDNCTVLTIEGAQKKIAEITGSNVVILEDED